jgi:predicted phage terminase large subunit-like protein
VAGIGQTKVGMHYDIIICDDLHSEKNITSKEMIEGVINHYKLLFSLLEPDGEMIVIGTRWDYSDLYQYIIDNESDRFKVFIRKAIQDDGTLLMPDRLTKEFLDNIKKTQGTYHFSGQYLNEPVSDETAVFKKEDFKHYKQEDLDIPLNIFMSVDPAISIEKTADYSAIVVGGFDNSGNIYILDIFRERVEAKDLINQIFTMAEKWRPRMVGIEVTAFQQVMVYNINEEMRARGIYLPISGLKRDTFESKEMRIRGLQPKYQAHQIYHPRKHAYLFDLEFELLRFPRGKTDDIIDAEADLLQIAYPRKNRSRTKYHKLPPRSKITGV